MTDFQNTETPSTILDDDSGPSSTGGGAPDLGVNDDLDSKEPLSLRGDLEAVFKEDREAKADKAEDDQDKTEEPKKDEGKDGEGQDEKAPAKPAEKPEPKPANEEAPPKKEAEPEAKQDGVGYREAPKNFLPDAKEKWINVPRAVRRDIETMIAQQDQEREQVREVRERYENVREFDELARHNGRDLRESLSRVVEFENTMASNPIKALQMALIEAGPRKADGTPLSLMEVAQYIVNAGPQGYQQMMATQQQPHRQQDDPRVGQLEQQIKQMQETQLVSSVIEPFKASHPRFAELESDIAFFLQSGKIPTNLSHIDRLEAAYDMAVRINPSSKSAPQAEDEGPDRNPRRAGDDFGGTKSIKSSPGSVTETVDDEGDGGESIRDSILKAARRQSKV